MGHMKLARALACERLTGRLTAGCARQVNQRISKTAHIKELNTEIGRLKAELHATREKNGVYIPLEHFHQQEQVRRGASVRVDVHDRRSLNS